MSNEVYIAGIGSFSPGDPVPFDQIEKILGPITKAAPKLIKRIDRMRKVMKELLGIEYSHYALDAETRELTETNVSMCVKAAKKALDSCGMDASEIEFIVYTGILYDYLCPPSSALVQDALGIPNCAEISIHSNCTSIYKGLQVAADLIAHGRYRNALIVSAQMSSPFLRAEYFNQKALTEEQAVLRWFLGDGAGALVLSREKPSHPVFKVVDTYLESVGTGMDPAMKLAIGAVHSNIHDIYDHGWHHLTQDLKTVAKVAPDLFRNGLNRMIERTGLNVNEVKCFFANIPTKHLMDLTIQSLRRDWHTDLFFYTKLNTRGYQGAPAILIALDEYLRETAIERGDIIVSFVTESSKWMHAGFILEVV